ncbi:MAG TPA: DUF1206 domain-containing protein [Thermohalobaculum sp.]|nr:DUF1206 domain-containing protein [Thermohalobaculum sp.]
MPDRVPAWVDSVMRIGYGGRAIVYVVVGVLAFLAAWQGGSAEGTAGALQQIKDQSWGTIVLISIALGMFCYAAWRVIDGVMDLEAHGTGAKGFVARTGLIVTGLIHLALGIYVVTLLLGNGGGSGGSDSSPEGITAKVMEYDRGRWVIGIAGLCVIGAGIYYFIKGYKEKYRSEIHATRMTERLNPVLKAGLYAHGVVIVLIGIFLFWAAWTYDSSQAGGLADAFHTIRGAAFGRILLGLVALGLVGFAVFCAVSAVYRIVPRLAGDDIPTLARQAEGKAHRAKAEAKAAMR